MLGHIQTEEATKNALIMPFIQVLGYDVFNPFEVTPEFIADIGTKKGEKVDYAILQNGNPVILIECKHHSEKLDPHSSQLFRYFITTSAKFGLLTNGLVYRFYTDLVETNKMDEKPFFEFSITDIKDSEIIELRKFHKSYFDLENIINTASELKYSNEIKAILSAEIKSPSTSFVKFFTSQVYDGKVTEKVLNQFNNIVKKSVNQLITDMINERLKLALEKENSVEQKQEVSQSNIENSEEKTKDKGIETTEQEIEGFFIVKSIIRQKIDPSRINHRDTKTYFGILMDDNNRKPICRLWLNGSKKYIGIFDESKNEVKYELTKLDDIFTYSPQLLATVERYNNQA